MKPTEPGIQSVGVGRRARTGRAGRRRLAAGIVHILLAALLEIGLVPAATLEAETGSRHLPLQRGLAAIRAVGEVRVAHALDLFQFVTAGLAFVFVDRHNPNSVKNRSIVH